MTPSTGTQLHDLTALEQAAAVRAREVSPTELVEHSLARIQALDAGIGAFITVTADRARAAAARADRAVLDGVDLPPLHGVPTAIKDLNNTAGVRTTFGSRVLAEFVPDVDDAVVTALAAAGTISVGRPAVPGTRLCWPAAPAVARPRRSPPGSCRSRRAPTAVGPSASRPASTGCSGSSPAAGGSATAPTARR